MLGVGAKKKIYVDSIFDNTVYTGVSGSGVQFTNGIDMAGEKGMVWVKSRGLSKSWYVFDNVANTAQGGSPDHSLYLNTTSVTPVNNTAYQVTMNSNGVTSPTTDDSDLGGNGEDYYMPIFRQAPGFFDIVTWTGNDTSGRTISHSLGSVPGCVIVKCTTHSDSWQVWHRNTGGNQYTLELESSNARITETDMWNSTAPTASSFTLGNSDKVNGSGRSYVAYVFAGGESTNALARSVDFDGTGDDLSIPDSSDFDLGSGDFTIECWAKVGTSNGVGQESFICQWVSGQYAFFFGAVSEYFHFYWSTTGSNSNNHNSGYKVTRDGQWHHYAVTRNGNDLKFFVDGSQRGGTFSMSGVTINNSSTSVVIGDNPDVADGSRHFNGKISNVRVVKGTAVYTSSFRPPTEPLTNITNTKLLCCNNSSTTGSTVTPGTITANGNPTASTDSPFDDPAAFTFGENGDQNVIKCGSYRGSSSAPVAVELGFEPQWVLIKNVTDSGGTSWYLGDAIRGTVTGGQDARFYPNDSNAEVTNEDHIDFTSTGFRAKNNDGSTNDDHTHIFVAIRRADGYVGKPAETATDIFTIDTGKGLAVPIIPTYDSNFPVDFALRRKKDATDDWDATSRLIQGNRVKTNSNVASSGSSTSVFDCNTGWNDSDNGSAYLSWMWKRHAGFDILTDIGTGSAKSIPHSLGKVPEMIWRKSTSNAHGWTVYHKGLNGGTTPQNYWISLSSTDAEGDADNVWNDTAPTSTHFTVGNGQWVSDTDATFMTMLFASVEGISKCGYFDGSSSSQTITTGFQPRFLIIKCSSNDYENWFVLDTTRGWGSGNDEYLVTSTNAAQVGNVDIGAPTSTGFTLTHDGGWNYQGRKYIYYAHA